MYKPKINEPCKMPAPGIKLKALILNGSLKHKKDLSNTGELAGLVITHMAAFGVESEIIRLADKNIPVGLNFRIKNDDWPSMQKIHETDILILRHPFGGEAGQTTQRVIERLDAFDEEYHQEAQRIV
jgi:multimeric flavodoxin WrbA